jgi:hypothetical protein
LGSVLVATRLDAESSKRLGDLARAKHIKRAEALREAVKEYLALYIIGSEPTVGRLFRRVQDIDARLTNIENLLMEKGAQK